MDFTEIKRVPRHIGIIPDGNRRWAVQRGFEKGDGYTHGIDPGMELYKLCVESGVEELTFYGFTQDNTKRPRNQKEAFQKACVDAVKSLASKDADLLIVGDSDSEQFPAELLPFRERKRFGRGSIKINFLVNYGWNWDLNFGEKNVRDLRSIRKNKNIASSDISRIDLVIRWGGRRRLSGFLPIQTVYSDFYIIDDYWPDFKPDHFYEALYWYQDQDITLGG